MSDKPSYSYYASVKSSLSDELINTYVIRPIAGLLVRIFYRAPVTPNQVTILSTLAGFLAALFFLSGSASLNILAGLNITIKDVLDSADGQLARARQQYSRTGRFLDSIGDFLVNLAVFAAIGYALFHERDFPWILPLAAGAFLGTTLRVSYHVFYQTNFLHLQSAYAVNRVTEEIRDEDRAQHGPVLFLQRVFQLLYGWQDRLMVRLDQWSRRTQTRFNNGAWFGDELALRLSGLYGLGTELFLLMIFSVINELEMYLYFNLLGLNLLWFTAIAYRRYILAPRLSASALPAQTSDSP